MKEWKVVIDDGHGGFGVTPGKRTPDGEFEWSFNNQVGLAAIAELNTYENVKVLRTDDPTGKTDVPLKTRTDKANEFKADVLVSIHHNASKGVWGTWTGTETFVMDPAANNPNSLKLAKEIHPRVVKAMGLKDRGIKAENFHMLRESNMAAVLVEGGYMDSTIDIKKLRDDNVLKAEGQAIAQGIAAYLGLKKKIIFKPIAKPTPTPVIKPAEVPGKDQYIHRVIVNGVQVGAFGKADGVAEAVKQAVLKGAKDIKIERV
jgi:N-acetylmuramoyl-L-alanine amidase